jgi:hypothetical protein
MKRPPKKTLQAIIALVVAFALGAAAGGLVEHQRLKDQSNKKAAAPPTTTSKGKAAAARWFTAPTTAACPEIVKWKSAVTTAYVALFKKTPWSTTQSTLETQSAAETAALKALLPHSNKRGHKGLNVLIGYQTKSVTALKAAKTEADYLKAVKPASTLPVKNGNKVMTVADTACAKTS